MTNSKEDNLKAPAADVLDSTANDRFAAAKARRQAAMSRDTSTESAQMQREREPDLGGHRLKLSVRGTIPGYTMYWENDEDGKIEELLYEGFDFVDPSEIGRASDIVADMDVANRVSRYVGRREDGSPLRAYLLKCPDEIWAQRKTRDQRQVDEWDNQIRNGRMKPQSPTEYVPTGYNNQLLTNSKV